MLMSKTVSLQRDGKVRNMLFIDVKQAHLNLKCQQGMYFEIPDEAEPTEGNRGKLNFWLHGFRPAAQAWESLYAGRSGEVGFQRG